MCIESQFVISISLAVIAVTNVIITACILYVLLAS